MKNTIKAYRLFTGYECPNCGTNNYLDGYCDSCGYSDPNSPDS